jgi:putative membrane protein
MRIHSPAGFSAPFNARFLHAIALAILSAALAAANLSSDDKNFLSTAAHSGLAQLALANLALEKSNRADVKMYAHQVAGDYQKSNQDLRQLAEQKKLAFPSDVTLKDKAERARLELLSGDQFDDAYITAAINYGTENMKTYRSESAGGMDSDVRQFASKNLPIVREHLTMIKAIRGKTNATAK